MKFDAFVQQSRQPIEMLGTFAPRLRPLCAGVCSHSARKCELSRIDRLMFRRVGAMLQPRAKHHFYYFSVRRESIRQKRRENRVRVRSLQRRVRVQQVFDFQIARSRLHCWHLGDGDGMCYVLTARPAARS